MSRPGLSSPAHLIIILTIIIITAAAAAGCASTHEVAIEGMDAQARVEAEPGDWIVLVFQQGVQPRASLRTWFARSGPQLEGSSVQYLGSLAESDGDRALEEHHFRAVAPGETTARFFRERLVPGPDGLSEDPDLSADVRPGEECVVVMRVRE